MTTSRSAYPSWHKVFEDELLRVLPRDVAFEIIHASEGFRQDDRRKPGSGTMGAKAALERLRASLEVQARCCQMSEAPGGVEDSTPSLPPSDRGHRASDSSSGSDVGELAVSGSAPTSGEPERPAQATSEVVGETPAERGQEGAGTFAEAAHGDPASVPGGSGSPTAPGVDERRAQTIPVDRTVL